MFNSKSIECEVLTVKNDYYCVNIDKNNVINVPLYLSFKDSELINIKEIDYVSIVNNDETEIIPSSILEINYLNEINYDNKKFYQYDLKIELDFIVNDLTVFDEIFLKFNYHRSDPLKILIGSLCLYNYKNNEEMYYTSLKGLTKNYNNEEMLVGVIVKLELLRDVRIENIISMNRNVEIDLENTQVIEKEEERNILELEYDDYNIIGIGNMNNPILVKDKDYLFIALKYKDYIELPVQGFIIKYNDNGRIKEKVINPFLYYKTSNYQREIIKVTYERN